MPASKMTSKVHIFTARPTTVEAIQYIGENDAEDWNCVLLMTAWIRRHRANAKIVSTKNGDVIVELGKRSILVEYGNFLVKESTGFLRAMEPAEFHAKYV